MPWIDAFAPAEAFYAEQMRRATWGHLAPQKNKVYRGHVTFAIGCYGSDYLNPTVLEVELGELPSSPWFYAGLLEFLGAEQRIDTQRFKIGGVYRFDGSFRNYKFKGTFKCLLEPK